MHTFSLWGFIRVKGQWSRKIFILQLIHAFCQKPMINNTSMPSKICQPSGCRRYVTLCPFEIKRVVTCSMSGSLMILDIDDPKISQKLMFGGIDINLCIHVQHDWQLLRILLCFLYVREPCQKWNHVYLISWPWLNHFSRCTTSWFECMSSGKYLHRLLSAVYCLVHFNVCQVKGG